MDADLANALRLRGVDVLTALEAGMIEKPDSDHLKFATLQSRVLYSFNVGDFASLHGEFLAEGRSHAGIVVGQQQRYPIGEQMRRLLRVVAERTADEMKDRLEFLGSW